MINWRIAGAVIAGWGAGATWAAACGLAAALARIATDPGAACGTGGGPALRFIATFAGPRRTPGCCRAAGCCRTGPLRTACGRPCCGRCCGGRCCWGHCCCWPGGAVGACRGGGRGVGRWPDPPENKAIRPRTISSISVSMNYVSPINPYYSRQTSTADKRRCTQMMLHCLPYTLEKGHRRKIDPTHCPICIAIPSDLSAGTRFGRKPKARV